jgi:uncharacterized protein (DUF1330 family)
MGGEMPALLIVDVVEVRDAEKYAQYRERVPETLARVGATYLARGHSISVFAGEWTPDRVVVVQFPSMDVARTWWESDDYAEMKKLREESTRMNMVLVEAFPEPTSSPALGT